MNRKLQHSLLGALAVLSLGASASAANIQYKDEATGFVYIIDTVGKEAGVYSAATLTGAITVPDEVTYEGKAYTVTSILDDAFISNSKLTSVTTGKNLKSIGESAFKSSKIETVKLAAVEQIGKTAFAKCELLRSIDLGSSLKNIGAEAFGEAKALTGVFAIPASVTSMGANPWYSCSGLTGFSGGNSSNFSISDGVLYNNSGSTLISYPAGKTNTSFSVPAKVTEIGESAFRGAPLTTVSLGEGVKILAPKCLYSSKLTALDIPASVDSIGQMAITNSRNLTDVKVAAGNKSFKYADGYLTTADGKRLLFSQWRSGDLEIPEGIATVDDYTFFEMNDITSLTLPSSMRILGELAFYNCAGLKSIDFGNGIQQVSRMCFQNCKALTAVKIPASMRILGLQAFCYDEKISTLTIAEGLERMDDSVFLGCKAIRRVTLPSTMKQWGAAIFYQCTRLMVAVLGEGTTVVPDQMFNYDTNLYDVTLPNTVKTIERASFYSTKVTEASFKWPEQLDSIGFTAFYGTAFKNIEFPEKLRVIGEWAFAYSSSIETVKLGSGVRKIENLAFAKDTKLKEITLNDGLETIGDQVFAYCESMPSITIPASVKSIGNQAFIDMTDLTTIKMLNPVPPVLTQDILKQVEYPLVTLEVPMGAADAYRKADIWKNFTTIKESEGAGVEETTVAEPVVVGAFTMDGVSVDPESKGLIIVKYSDGTTRKVMNK